MKTFEIARKTSRVFALLFIFALIFLVALSALAYASTVDDDLYAWNYNGEKKGSGVVIAGNGVSLYDYPSAESSSNSKTGTLNGTYRATAIGRNQSNQWYYSLTMGTNHTYYVRADKVTTDYNSDLNYTIEILDSERNNPLHIAWEPSFRQDYELNGTFWIDSNCVELIHIRAYLEDEAGNVYQSGAQTVNQTGVTKYTLSPSSLLSSQLDFNGSNLTVGNRYILEVDADLVDHYHPYSATSVGDEFFTRTVRIPFTLQQGELPEVSVNTSGLRVPTAEMTCGEKYSLKGTITSTGANLSMVSAYVYPANDLSHAATGTSVSVNTTSYSIYQSELDSGCKFATLAKGSYVYILSAEAGGKSFELNRTNFTVVETTYTVSYDANGGTGAPGNQTKTKNVALTLSSTVPQHQASSAGSYTLTFSNWNDDDGGVFSQDRIDAAITDSYRFTGWNTAADGSGVSYAPGAVYTGNAALNLYAQWERNRNAEEIILPTGERQSYELRSWVPHLYTSVYDQFDLTPGSRFIPFEDAEFSPEWEWLGYTVTYDANGGTSAPPAQRVNQGEGSLIPNQVPVMEGGTNFLGWARNAEAAEAEFFPGQSYSFQKNTTLYAVWDSFRVTYVVNGRETIQGSQGNVITLHSNVPEYYPDNSNVLNADKPEAQHTFLYWSDGISETQYHPGDTIILTDNLKLTAIWDPSEHFTSISFLVYIDKYGELVRKPNPQTVGNTYRRYMYETKIPGLTVGELGWSFPNESVFGYPCKYGQKIIGWLDTDDVPLTSETVVDENNDGKTYLGIFSNYVISYNANGGSIVPEEQGGVWNTELILDSSVPIREGFCFLGWASNADAVEPEYHNGDSFVASSGSNHITLYAVWAQPDLVLPAALITIEEESFAGGSFDSVYIPTSTISIDPRAFGDRTELTVYGVAGSKAEAFADRKGFTFVAVA